MEAVLSNAELLVILIGNGVHICLFGHCLVERGIKNSNLRNFLAENLGAGVNALNVSGIVQGCKGRELLDFAENVGVDKNGMIKVSAALYYAVADCGNLAQILDCAVLGVDKSVLNSLKCLSVVLHLGFAFNLLTVVGLKADKRAVCADSFAVALSQYALVCHINKLILKRRASGVDN